jgi:uncharacterized protein
MLILSLAAIDRAPVRLQDHIPAADPLWGEVGLVLRKPLRVDLEARRVGDGVLVRGELETELEAGCRRCLVSVPAVVRDTIDLLFEPISAREELELGGEVYPLPERGAVLDLSLAVREQLVLRVPDYVVCSESCLGLCPRCGAELNRGACGCVPDRGASPWDALKEIKFE